MSSVRAILNRALGIPIFLLAMHLMFMFTINIGGKRRRRAGANVDSAPDLALHVAAVCRA
ncbi:MAG: hypothetical protein MI753_14400 [Hyphomicrobiales bacterium]|nr:hypothetical protein [Hyphomicrobiales bacterium]